VQDGLLVGQHGYTSWLFLGLILLVVDGLLDVVVATSIFPEGLLEISNFLVEPVCIADCSCTLDERN
jgi:hypothetical protein